jgi:serine/threonine-protein kinase
MQELLQRVQPHLADRYDLQFEIGHGSNAVVFFAEDWRHRRPVAVKVLLDDVDQVRWRRFEREIAFIARLSHPHIVPLLDSGVAGGLPFYVMPKVDGPSLRVRLGDGLRLPLEEIVQVTAQVAAALTYAHQFRIVHRDVKPENILLSPGGALVADFGIARATASNDATLTKGDMTVGTPAYMSPEQVRGDRKLDGRADLYSLACVAFEMLVGRPPFQGHDAAEVMRRQLVDEPPSVRPVRRDLTERVDLVLRQALAKKRHDRHPTAAKFAREFASAAGFDPGIALAGIAADQPSLVRRLSTWLQQMRHGGSRATRP